jgi:hypothetical protein
MHACNNTSRRCVYKATNSPAPSHLSQKRGQPGSYDATQTSPAGASASTNPVPQGQAHQPTQSRRAKLINQPQSRRRKRINNPSPAGTKENSPGLQSWVNPGTPSSPVRDGCKYPRIKSKGKLTNRTQVPQAQAHQQPQSRRRKRINNPSPAGAAHQPTPVPQAQAHQPTPVPQGR